jgi:hypothetical protein
MDPTKLFNTNNDPTPKLKSSPIPIKFISFNNYDDVCIYCKELYEHILLTGQQYCKKCLSCYLTNITDNDIYLDVYYTMNSECIEHETNTKEPQVIQECCKNCLKVLCFKQIFAHETYFDCDIILGNSITESEKYCKLCGKPTSAFKMKKFKLCSDCYLITSGYIESTLTKKPILVIYLPWWHNISSCDACNTHLIFASDRQKYCEKCFIFYIGCRYCLTTNVIFGLTTQSQCKKCKRVSSSIIADNFSGNSELDEFLVDLFPNIHNNLKTDEFVDKIKNIDKYFLPSEISLTINSMCKNSTQSTQSEDLMKWIQYSHFTNVTEIARGGFGIIYRATWDQKSVILKKFKNSQDTSKYFLNEVRNYSNNCVNHFIK